MSDGQTNYAKYRGKCYQLSTAACERDPSLRLVRGYYYDPTYGRQPHWWCVREDGSIVDPTAAQFPSNGTGTYEKFDGWVECSECGKRILLDQAEIGGNGHYAFCSYECHGRFVGVF